MTVNTPVKPVEARWAEISALTASALEREIALVQAKVIQTEIASKQVAELVIERGEGEGEVQFQSRKEQLKQQVKALPVQLKHHAASLEALAEAYVAHINGNSFIGKKAGALENLSELLERS